MKLSLTRRRCEGVRCPDDGISVPGRTLPQELPARQELLREAVTMYGRADALLKPRVSTALEKVGEAGEAGEGGVMGARRMIRTEVKRT